METKIITLRNEFMNHKMVTFESINKIKNTNEIFKDEI